jgi:hypothetical protein
MLASSKDLSSKIWGVPVGSGVGGGVCIKRRGLGDRAAQTPSKRRPLFLAIPSSLVRALSKSVMRRLCS